MTEANNLTWVMSRKLIQGCFILPPHLFLCSDPLGVGSFFKTLHADCVELYHALCKRDEVQDVSKWLQECNNRMSNNLIRNTERMHYTVE